MLTHVHLEELAPDLSRLHDYDKILKLRLIILIDRIELNIIIILFGATACHIFVCRLHI